MKKIISILIPIFISTILIININSFLDKELVCLANKKDISILGKKYADPIKDKSSIIKSFLSEKGDLFLLGSSELGTKIHENAVNLFPINDQTYDLSCFGRPYCQDLQQGSALASANIKENQKVAFIVSIEWFERLEAIEPYNFAVNFSDIQFYNFLNNPKISEENKYYYAQRTYSMLSKSKKYPAEALYAKLYYSNNFLYKPIEFILSPYYKIKQYLLNVKDKALIYKEIKRLPNKGENLNKKEIDWDKEYSKIKKENKKATYENEFHLEDSYYKSHLGYLNEYGEGSSKDEELMKSKEVGDYKFFLSTCKEIGVKPYIIMLPVNGWYFDYLGLTKEKRDEYYNEITRLANEDNLEVLDLREYEYKEGFLGDPMHFGKEGWLKVSEEIYKQFEK